MSASVRATGPDSRTGGLEVHEPHPVVLGGDPSDPKNKLLLEPITHAQPARFFNKIFKQVRLQTTNRRLSTLSTHTRGWRRRSAL